MSVNNYWEARIINIKEKVSMRSLLDYYNIPCQAMGEITQVHCPFHGSDQHASARVYETNTMYCWVCSKMWDVISFIRDHKGVGFRDACAVLEDMYNIAKPDNAISYQEESFMDFLNKISPVKEKDFDRDFDKISDHLIKNKESFSLSEYVKYFYFFDKLYINYRENSHSNDTDLGNSLNNLFKEISAN